jgi:NAD(P)-dependent dehydrogenase (short-subunit alcohol dehydrogenase family)
MTGVAGRVALVTGGRRGIGRAIALRLAQAGAAVGIMALHNDAVTQNVVREITALGVPGLAVAADVADGPAVAQAVAAVEGALGPVTILVSNAGLGDRHYTTAANLAEPTWDRMLAVNLKSVYLCCVAVLPAMLAAGHGRIINIASTSGLSGGTSGIHYAAAKGGVIAMSKALAREYADQGITVNVVAPSKIDTDMLREVTPDDRIPALIRKIPVGRLGDPADIAEAVLYFALDEAGFTTGQVLCVSGGY